MLAIIATHPIQYQVPVWQELARRGNVPFEVRYLTVHGVAPSVDDEFGRAFKWDLDLLDGYAWRAARSAPPRLASSPIRVGLPAEFAAQLVSGKFQALLLPGWGVRACWEAAAIGRLKGSEVWIRGDSNDLKPDRWEGGIAAAKRIALRSYFSLVDRFLCVGAANRRLYERFGIPAHRLVDGLHAVDNERFATQASELRSQRAEIRSRWNIPDDAFCVLYAGKLIPKKRPLDVIGAVMKVQGIDPGAKYHLLVVGTGQLEDEVRRSCDVRWDYREPTDQEDSGNRGPVLASLAGFLNQLEMPRAYVAADVLVLASDEGETWGLVVNEAMASGLQCIASRSCGCSEDLVIPLRESLAFECGDVTALALCIREARARPVPQADVERLISRYSIQALADALESLWKQVGRPGARP